MPRKCATEPYSGTITMALSTDLGLDNYPHGVLRLSPCCSYKLPSKFAHPRHQRSVLRHLWLLDRRSAHFTLTRHNALGSVRAAHRTEPRPAAVARVAAADCQGAPRQARRPRRRARRSPRRRAPPGRRRRRPPQNGTRASCDLPHAHMHALTTMRTHHTLPAPTFTD